MTEPVELPKRVFGPCPICRKKVDAQSPLRSGPFCSKRCAQIDMGRWLQGSYAIPVSDDEAERLSSDDLDEP
jgi:uncharacterized protein